VLGEKIKPGPYRRKMEIFLGQRRSISID